MRLPLSYLLVVRKLVACLPPEEIDWALTGSTAHALQGVPVDPHDIDVQTNEAGTWRAAEALAPFCVTSPRLVESDLIRSLLGSYAIGDVPVELIGAVQKREPDGSWGTATDPADHRRVVRVDNLDIPVLSLEYEAAAYAALGRHDRAKLLRGHVSIERA